MNKKRFSLIVGPVSLILVVAVTIFGVRGYQFSKLSQATPLSYEEEQVFTILKNASFPQRNGILQKLPFEINIPQLDVGADSAILIDISNGSVIYEKNADEIIPPASMTKLFALFVVEEEIEKGNLSYNQIIPLPEECWACNMPPHSSLMFLGEGQVVTLEELLLGLSVCSGNDAAYALAYTICGSMEKFVDRMNEVASNYGLENTKFVESSGYSERNTTTAREMAAFCRIYLTKYPESLARYHSVEKFTYPKEKNLAPGDTIQNQDFTKGFPRHITMPITQKNTNPLLGKITGTEETISSENSIICDGLKTGYIEESGYNLALTAHNEKDRFLSVTMKGHGNNTAEGQKGRIHDGTVLMTWAFESFADYKDFSFDDSYFVKVYGSKEKAINLVPAFNIDSVTVPFITGENVAQCVDKVKIVVEYPETLNFNDEIIMGQTFGSIKFVLNETVIDEIPLIADRTATKANFICSFVDSILKN